MGNEHTKDQVDLFSSHPNFKNAKVITQKNQRHIVTTVTSDDEGYNAWKQLLSKHLREISKSEFLLLPKQHSFSKQGFCVNTGDVIIDYEYSPYLLSEQIANRHEKQQRFGQSDLWYLLYILAGAKNQAHELNQRVGDIKPENVFINSDGQVKIGSLFSYPNEHSNYKKTIDLETTLLAPQALARLKSGATDNQVDQNSQVFSIGLTVIAAGILENPSPICNVKNFTFDRTYATEVITRWKNSKHYSEVFRGIIANLVSLNPQERLSAAELWTWISKYQANIKQKQKFIITFVPNKIQRQIKDIKNLTRSSNVTKQQQTYGNPKEESQQILKL